MTAGRAEETVAVKICGLCRAADARAAAEAGAAWAGVILAPGRGRTQTVAQASVIFDAVAGSMRRVGVFVDATAAEVLEAARLLELDAVQLHGDEALEVVARMRAEAGCEIWKAVRVRNPSDVGMAARTWRGRVDALLLDGWSPDAHGGVGARFDWAAAAAAGVPADMRVVAAGGLTPENVAAAISLLRPAIVDVSSGVESAPGRKSPEKIQAFVAAVRGVRDMR